MGWVEKKLIAVSVLVGFLYMSTSRCLCLRVIVRSRKSIDPCCSYVEFCLMLLCILLAYVLMVCGSILVVSYMINISSSRCFKLVSSKCCKDISAIMPDIGVPIAKPCSG